MTVWVERVDGIEFRKVKDNQVQRPRAFNRIAYYSADQSALTLKTETGSSIPLATRAQAAGVVPFGVHEARPLVSGTDFADLYVWSWTDLYFPGLEGDRNRDQLVIEEYRDTGQLKSFFPHNANRSLSFEYQMGHDWAGTAVRFHLHTVPMAAASGSAYWTGSYFFGGAGDEVPAASGWTSFTRQHFYYATDQYERQYDGVVHCSAPASPGNSDVLSIVLTRTTTSGSDTYTGGKDHETATANLAIESADIHYQRLEQGSEEEFTGSVVSNPSRILFDPDSYSGDVYLQCTVKANTGNPCTFRLYDVTGSAAVADSAIATSSSDYAVSEAGPLTLTSGVREYRVQARYDSAADEPKLASAAFVVR